MHVRHMHYEMRTLSLRCTYMSYAFGNFLSYIRSGHLVLHVGKYSAEEGCHLVECIHRL